MMFLMQKLINTITIQSVLVFGSFSEENQPLTLITVGVYAKRRPKFSCILKYKVMQLKI